MKKGHYHCIFGGEMSIRVWLVALMVCTKHIALEKITFFEKFFGFSEEFKYIIKCCIFYNFLKKWFFTCML